MIAGKNWGTKKMEDNSFLGVLIFLFWVLEIEAELCSLGYLQH